MESNFLISVHYPFNVIKIAAAEQIVGGVNIYLCGCVSLLAPECAVCICLCDCVCVCDIKLEYQKKTTSCVRHQQT